MKRFCNWLFAKSPAPVWGVFMTATAFGLAELANHPEYFVPAAFFS